MKTHIAKVGRIHREGARQQGFTLIELMIVVAVIAILTIIAVSSYDWAVTKSRRKAAEGCLQQSAQYMERWYATNLRYDATMGGVAIVGATATAACTTDVTKFYTVALAATTATTYSLTATPIAGGPQAKDSLCLVLGVDQTGKQTATGSGGPTACW